MYKSRPKIKHDKCGASKDIEELFEDQIEDKDYYLWAVLFPYSKNYIDTITAGEEFFEFGDISIFHLNDKYFKEDLQSEI